MANSKADKSINVLEVTRGSFATCVVGTSPLIFNRVSQKSMAPLLLPSGRKTTAERAGTLKHDPLREYRDSPYVSRDEDNRPTRLQLLGSMFKRSMETAALDLPGARKAQISRLLSVPDERIDLYGVPQMFMAVARSSDINHTPDVRTRAIVPRWCCIVPIVYAVPILSEHTSMQVLNMAGMVSGVGDWRIQRGGSYGGFRLCGDDDPEFRELQRYGLAAQDAALKDPLCYNEETDTLYAWYQAEVKRRGFKEVDSAKILQSPQREERGRRTRKEKAPPGLLAAAAVDKATRKPNGRGKGGRS